VNFDLDAIDDSKQSTFDVVVGNLDNGGTVGFRVLGTGSNEYQKARREVELFNVKQSAQSRKRLDMATNDGAEFVVDTAEKNRVVILNACIVDWFGFTLGGARAELNEENLSRVFKARPGWAEIVLREIENDANFIKG